MMLDQSNNVEPCKFRILATGLHEFTRFGYIKDYFYKNTDGIQPFVTMLEDPETNRCLGAAILDFRSDAEVQLALLNSDKLFRGKPIKLVRDPESTIAKNFVREHGYFLDIVGRKSTGIVRANGDSKIASKDKHKDRRVEKRRRETSDVEIVDDRKYSRRGKKQESEEENGIYSRTRGNQDEIRDVTRRNRDAREQIKSTRSSREMRSVYSLDRPPYGSHNLDDKGRPLIDNIRELCRSVIFFDGFHPEVDEAKIQTCFEQFGNVATVSKFKHSGIVEFFRARDAERTLVMIDRDYEWMHLKEKKSSIIKVRIAKELRLMPDGLRNIARPLPESECVQMCKNTLGIDPYAKCQLFCTKFSSMSEEGVLKTLFSFVGKVVGYKRIYMKNSTNLSGATISMETGYDGAQAIHVLNDAEINGQKVTIRLDKFGQSNLKPLNDQSGIRVEESIKQNQVIYSGHEHIGMHPGVQPVQYMPANVQAIPMIQGAIPGRQIIRQQPYQINPMQHIPQEVPRHITPYQNAIIERPPVNGKINNGLRQGVGWTSRKPAPVTDQRSFNSNHAQTRFQSNNDLLIREKYPPVEPPRPVHTQPDAYVEPEAPKQTWRKAEYRPQVTKGAKTKQHARPTSSKQPTEKEDIRELAKRLGISSKMVTALQVIAKESKESDESTSKEKHSYSPRGIETKEPWGQTSNKTIENENNWQNKTSESGKWETLACKMDHSNSKVEPVHEAKANVWNDYKHTVYNDKHEPESNFGENAIIESNYVKDNRYQPQTDDTVYFRNLPPTMSENKLKNMMATFGQIVFMDFPRNPDHSSAGYAYIRFSRQDCMNASDGVIKRWNGQILERHRLDVGLY